MDQGLLPPIVRLVWNGMKAHLNSLLEPQQHVVVPRFSTSFVSDHIRGDTVLHSDSEDADQEEKAVNVLWSRCGVVRRDS